MARPSRRASGAHRLTTGTSAVQDGVVDLGLRDPGQLAQMHHRGGDVGRLRRYACITGELMDVGDQGADLAERVQRRGCLCWQAQFVFAAKKPFGEAIQFLPADQRQFGKPGSGFGNVGPDQPEGFAALLVPRQAVPEAIDECADQFVGRIEAFEYGKFASPQVLHDIQGRHQQSRRGDAAEKSRPDFMERNRAGVRREKRLDRLLVSRDRRSRRVRHGAPALARSSSDPFMPYRAPAGQSRMPASKALVVAGGIDPALRLGHAPAVRHR